MKSISVKATDQEFRDYLKQKRAEYVHKHRDVAQFFMGIGMMVIFGSIFIIVANYYGIF